MADRNEYMREYMRERRARLKAERLAAGGETATPSRARAARSTEPEEEYTTEGGGGIGGWLWFGAIVLVVVIACVQGWRNGTPEERADTLYKAGQAANQAFNQFNQGQDNQGRYGYNPYA